MKRIFQTRIIVILFLFIAATTTKAQDDVTYKAPPKDIADLVLSKATPGVIIDRKGEWMILAERSEFPTIEDMAQPELRIAGLRINPRNFGPSRAGYSISLQGGLFHQPSTQKYSNQKNIRDRWPPR
jgi:hypothetical protein